MSAHGGARAGAGRKPNASTRATQAIRERVTAGGATPLEVMIDAMRFVFDLAQTGKGKDGAPVSQVVRIELYKEASDLAAKAAPYMHARLNAIAVTPTAKRDVSDFTDDELATIASGISGAIGVDEAS
jgi:hypothetical protein